MTSNKRPPSIGARVQELREQSSMTQSKLAESMGISRETLNHWESNAREIKATQVLKLADLFNVTCDYILRGVSADNVEVHGQTGLKDEAIHQLKTIYNERSQYLMPPPVLKTDFFNYTLSNQDFMEKFPDRLIAYCNERLDDDQNAKRAGAFIRSEETDIASYLTTRLMQELAENCYKDFYKPLLERTKPKSSRKRKVAVTDTNDSKN